MFYKILAIILTIIFAPILGILAILAFILSFFKQTFLTLLEIQGPLDLSEHYHQAIIKKYGRSIHSKKTK